MRSLIEIQDTNDLRHLLYEYDESVDQAELVPIYEKIKQEYESISGNDDYKKHLQDVDRFLWDKMLIHVIKHTYKCISYGMVDLAKKLIEEYKLKIKIDESKKIDHNAIKTLENKADAIINKYKIKQLKQKEYKKENDTWESIQVYIHQILGVDPDYNCSVVKCHEYLKSCERKVKLQNSK